ncbi:MAG: magnesium chelatase [Polyangiaceae bacterium UTPRO1]|jgi:magnesium chelatase subunit I|nr:sigma 54-interacting transcriptional regulator [Myxococcales bacterium]OQY68890.1 MAG: magnesium chelatase [Polyangiaceae bacterium UTPRO1]
MIEQARTVGELRQAGYRAVPVREEMRRNLLAKLAAGEPILDGIIGYDDSVVPEIENAILAGHHIVFLGERGQGKSRIMRGLLDLLDAVIPAVAGCEINDDPMAPICGSCRRRAAAEGDALPIVWLERDRRYGEKLATPDVSMADLIGEIDPVKVAEGRYLANEETIHYGLVPRTHRGIFAINELPDLTEKVQVGLFNVMEEKDVQIKGYKVRLPLDVVIIASANPEDYTSRGRIITPLKDRFDAQIRTHYPVRIEDEIAIMEQEVSARPRAGREVRVPGFIKELLAQITMEARDSNEINQASGVSVRVTINNYESVIANAEKRAVRCGEREIVPRLTDLHAVLSSTAGKIELEYAGEEKKADDLIDRLTNRAVLKVFDRATSVDRLTRILEYFESGGGVEVSDRMPAADYLEGIRGIPGLLEAITALGPFESPALMAAASELVLEGLHVHRKLNKERAGGRTVYKS